MKIQKRRIRKLDPYLPGSAVGSQIVIGIAASGRRRHTLKRVGFMQLAAGEAVLPATTFGARSRFNANGRDLPQRALPKEQVCSMRQWCRKEWRGRNQREEVCDLRDRCYERYPRTHLPAPSVVLRVATNAQGKQWIVSPVTVYTPENHDLLLHTINLFLEIFGECEILKDNLEHWINLPIRPLHWQILPPGPQPWSRIRSAIDAIVQQAPRGNRALIVDRLQTILQHHPTWLAIGHAGFRGYFILGFPEKKMYVLESLACNNATYVLGEDWEQLSRLTKAELLQQHRHQARLIHRVGWHTQIQTLFVSS